MKRVKFDDLEVDLMLDSGAFSAWLRKTTIPIEDYIDYVYEHKDYLGCYISLDVIPGVHGIPRTSDQTAISSKASYKNQQIMKKAGLDPIPVFHQGEAFGLLRDYILDGETYIGISPWKDVPASVQRAWMDQCFTMLTDREGRPYVKVHGFATTNQPFMLRYPFYSVDSTTWSLGAGYGQIILPAVRSTHDSPWDWTEKPIRFVMSGIRQANNGAQMKQTEWLDAANYYDDGNHGKMYHVVNRWLEHIGLSFEQVRNDTNSRRRAFLIYFLQMAEHLKVERFTHRLSTKGENEILKAPVDLPPIKVQHLKLMFATTFKNRPWGDMMTDVGARTRLLSYWELRERTDEELRHFVTTGRCLVVKKARKPRGAVKKRSKQFTQEQREKIILETLQPGAQLKEIAEKHGVNGTTLSNWRTKFMTSPKMLRWKRSSYISKRAMALKRRAEAKDEV